METCDGPYWGVLAEELAELILSKVPLVDLARASATSRMFQAGFRRQLAQEQQACSDSGVDRLGRERIIALVALIDRVLKWEGMDTYVDRSGELVLDPGYCLLRDGTCHKGTPLSREPTNQITHVVDTDVQFFVMEEIGSHGMFMQMHVENGLCMSLEIYALPNEVGTLIKSASLALYGIEGVRVVQALLSEGLAQLFHDAGHQVEVMIRGHPTSKLTWAALRAVVAPVMPFITPRSFLQGELVGVLRLPTSG